MRGLLIIMYIFALIPVLGQTVCIIPDGYNTVMENGKKTITVCPDETVNLMAVDCNNFTQVKAYWYKDGSAIAPLYTYPASDAGSYVAEYRASDGTISKDEVVIKHKPVIDLSIYRNGVKKNGDNTCENKAVTYTGSTDPGVNNYRWYDLANPTKTLSNTSEVTINEIELDPGEKSRYIDLTLEAAYKGCNISTTMLLVVFAYPKFTLGPDTGFCPKQNLVLALPDSIKDDFSLSYKWNTGETDYYKTVTSPGNYSVKVTNNITKCQNSDTVSVIEFSQPILNLSENTSICPGSSVNLQASVLSETGTAPYSFKWSPEESLDDSQKANVLATPNKALTSYNVRITDKNNCQDSGSVEVKWFPEVKATVAFSDTISCQEPITLIAEGQEGTPFQESPYYQYSWSPSDNMTGSNTATPVVTPKETTTYTITVTDASGCIDDTSVTVTTSEFKVSILEGFPETVCENETVTLNAEVFGGEPAFSFVWEGTGLSTSTDTERTSSISVSPDPGNNKYKVKATDKEGCTNTNNITITTVPPTKVTVADDLYKICEGDSIRFNPASVESGSGNYLISWSGQNLSDDTTNRPLYNSQTETGTKTFIITVKDALSNCPESKDTVMVELISAPYAKLANSDTTICKGSSIELVPDTLNSGLRFEWRKLPMLAVISDANVLEVAEEGVYHLTAFEPIASCKSMDSIQVSHVQPLSEVTIQADTAAPNYMPYNISSISNNTNIKYLWSTTATGSFDNPTVNEATFNPSIENEDNSTFTLIVNNKCGDSLETTHSVRFYKEEIIKDKAPYVPTAFSPSAASQANQSLMVFSEHLADTDFYFSIYNRWGDLVYETKSLSEATGKGWNGEHQRSGKPLIMDVYTYILKGKYKNGDAFQKTGTVTLLR